MTPRHATFHDWTANQMLVVAMVTRVGTSAWLRLLHFLLYWDVLRQSDKHNGAFFMAVGDHDGDRTHLE